MVITMWIARDRHDTGGMLNLFRTEPKTTASGIWYSFPDKDFFTLDYTDFPEVTFDNSPMKVRVELLK